MKATARRKRASIPVRATPLLQRLRTPARATPQALLALAQRWWERGERFDIGRMAEELNVSRATVFRWVGSRELLYGEVISSLFEAALALALQGTRGTGATRVAAVTRKLMAGLIAHAPLQTFVKQDTEYALRVLMSKSSTVEQRCAASVLAALQEEAARGHIAPAMKLEDLAYLIVRIGESFLYREAITGEVDGSGIESAITAIRILVAARRGAESD